MTATKFLLIRHAESTWNRQDLWQGQADPPLSEAGIAQVSAAREAFLAENLDYLVSSDLQRAQATARLLVEGLSMSIRLEHGLREMDVGAWEGLPNPEIRRRWPEEIARFFGGDDEIQLGGGESRSALRERVLAVMSRLQAEFSGKRVGVVTHGGVIRLLLPGSRPGNLDMMWWERPEK